MATNGQLPTWEQLDAGRWLPASCRPPREMRDLLETADGQAKRRVKAEKTKAKAKSGKGGPSVNRPAPGFVVDENTAALGNTNRGHQLLMRMGWSEGIGINGGIVEPVKSRVHGKHSGLGA
ncbi:hypothetical protein CAUPRSCDRAFT_13031 [Caulochytrium protostelioides]|uniref:G-patch domain-containing protein n=1 Tax=Caulochytrium protostelioides TaxID=1555241 RepID=A0A4P9WVQ8_9FUNG|nr:hypothetical protein CAUPRSCDRAFT_13031 [Caulochytrium protostelioides]